MFLVVHGRWLGQAYRGNSAVARKLFKQVQLITEDDVWRRKAFLFAEAELHALTGDQLQLRSVCDAIAELAAKFPGWRPWLGYARAALHGARGRFAEARAELEPALQLARPGEHRAWTRLAPAHAEVLLLLEDVAGAVRAADAIVAEVERLGLDRAAEVSGLRIRALALAALGEHGQARDTLERAFEAARQLEYDGLPLAQLHEAGARIALSEGAVESCKAALAQIWKLIEHADAPAMINAYEALRAGSRKDLELLELPAAGTVTRTTFSDTLMFTQIQTRLAQFGVQQERLRQALSLLLEDSGAHSGHLLLFDQRGLFAAADVNETPPGDELLRKAQAFLDAQLELKTVTVTASEIGAMSQTGNQLTDRDTSFAPVALIDRGVSPPRLVGVALLAHHDLPVKAPRVELVRIVSRCLQEAGDSVSVMLED
jgi:tetratricopeptide (TPR) repeat protein